MSDPLVNEAIGVIDGANVDFQTAVAYQPGTVWLFFNGQLIPRENDDGGLIELGGVDVRLKRAPVVGDRIHFWFHTGPPTPGAFSQPPLALMAINLIPSPRVALALVPVPRDAQGEGVATDYVPRPAGLVPLAPDPEVGIELSPSPVSAEEV